MSASAGQERQPMLAIAWERHRRMDGMCRALGVPLTVFENPLPFPKRYWTLARQTWTQLRAVRPRILIVQNPSIVLTLLAVIWRPLLRYRLIVDAHNEAVTPHIYDVWPVRLMSRYLLRRADLTIVTNPALGERVKAAGGRPVILHDHIPDVEWEPSPAPAQRMRAAVISTFAPDEPLAELFEAARLRAETDFFVTGRYERAPLNLTAGKPANVHYTGFLSDNDYWALLRSVHFVVDLTSMPDCLVCGAYEAVAVGRPLLLSEGPAARELFEDSSCFTINQPLQIAAAVGQLQKNYATYAGAAIKVRENVQRAWDTRAGVLLTNLQPWLS